jgi:hypothetical protein
MALIGKKEIFLLLEKVCLAMEEASVDYLVYGSACYAALSGDEQADIHDLDIIVPQSSFGLLRSLLAQPELALKPIVTPYTVHANSLVYEGPDGRPFDVSLDAFEHYFQPSGFDLLRYTAFGPQRLKFMTREDLVRAYEIGLAGGNAWKLEEYEQKANRLRTLVTQS